MDTESLKTFFDKFRCIGIAIVLLLFSFREAFGEELAVREFPEFGFSLALTKDEEVKGKRHPAQNESVSQLRFLKKGRELGVIFVGSRGSAALDLGENFQSKAVDGRTFKYFSRPRRPSKGENLDRIITTVLEDSIVASNWMPSEEIAFVCEDHTESDFKIVERAALSVRRIPKSQTFSDNNSSRSVLKP